MPSTPGFASQPALRNTLRVVGVVSMAVALVLIAVAISDFFASVDTMQGPTKFWMFFLAMPFFVIGGAGLQWGFLGAAARYGAGETMPVVKDSAAYLSDGEGVLGVGRTVDDRPAGTTTGPFCSKCGVRNDEDAKFCDACGATIG